MRRYLFLILFLSILVSVNSCGNKGSKKSIKDTVATDSVQTGNDSNKLSENIIKPVFIVKNNIIDMDSISEYFIYQQYDGNLEDMNAFMSIGYNNNFARIAFQDDQLVVGKDTLFIYHEQRIVGSFMPAFNYTSTVEYLVINDAGDYGEEVDLISIDSTGKVIGFVELMSNGGDGGDHYEQRIRKIGPNQYQLRDMAIHYGFSDPDTVQISDDREWLLTLEEDGTFSKKIISNKKPYYKIFPAEEDFIDILFGNYQ